MYISRFKERLGPKTGTVNEVLPMLDEDVREFAIDHSMGLIGNTPFYSSFLLRGVEKFNIPYVFHEAESRLEGTTRAYFGRYRNMDHEHRRDEPHEVLINADRGLLFWDYSEYNWHTLKYQPETRERPRPFCLTITHHPEALLATITKDYIMPDGMTEIETNRGHKILYRMRHMMEDLANIRHNRTLNERFNPPRPLKKMLGNLGTTRIKDFQSTRAMYALAGMEEQSNWFPKDYWKPNA